MSIKAKVESVLFLTDKPIQTAAIAKLVNEDVQKVRQTVLALIQEYEERGGGLEIAQDNGYIIQVKDEYAYIIEEFMPMEMSAALLRTLSAVAIKQPVPQSEIIRIRGAGAYEHIKELVEKELVSKKEDGRSPILTTTKQFQEYFRLTSNAKSLRQQMKKKDEEVAAAQDAEGLPDGQLGIPMDMSAEGLIEPIGEAIGAATGESTTADQTDASTPVMQDMQYEEALEKLMNSAAIDPLATRVHNEPQEEEKPAQETLTEDITTEAAS